MFLKKKLLLRNTFSLTAYLKPGIKLGRSSLAFLGLGPANASLMSLRFVSVGVADLELLTLEKIVTVKNKEIFILKLFRYPLETSNYLQGDLLNISTIAFTIIFHIKWKLKLIFL